jgi:hypothetical protein
VALVEGLEDDQHADQSDDHGHQNLDKAEAPLGGEHRVGWEFHRWVRRSIR